MIILLVLQYITQFCLRFPEWSNLFITVWLCGIVAVIVDIILWIIFWAVVFSQDSKSKSIPVAL